MCLSGDSCSTKSANNWNAAWSRTSSLSCQPALSVRIVSRIPLDFLYRFMFLDRCRSLHLKSQGKEQTWSNLFHLARAQSRDERADFSLRDGLKMIKVNGAIPGHAVCLGQQNFGWNVPNGRGDRGDGHSPQKFHRRISGQNQNRPFLVRSGKQIPSDLASLHQSPQTCSDSQPLNSPRLTGLRL